MITNVIERFHLHQLLRIFQCIIVFLVIIEDSERCYFVVLLFIFLSGAADLLRLFFHGLDYSIPAVKYLHNFYCVIETEIEAHELTTGQCLPNTDATDYRNMKC